MSDRVEHAFRGVKKNCGKCGLPRKKHREKRIIGMGGIGRDVGGKHLYVYLCLVAEDGTLVAEAYDEGGLSHKRCLRVLFSASKRDSVFGFQTSYGATKIFEGIGSKKDSGLEKFFIFHPEARRTEIDGQTVTPLFRWKGRGYSADRSGFSVAEGWRRRRWVKSVRVWDLQATTRRPWAESLEAWGLEPPTLSEDIREACRQKAHLTALLANRVLGWVAGEGIDLKGRYRGPGSIAGVLMKRAGVDKRRGPRLEEMPTELRQAVLSGFFGGRQEVREMGPVRELLREYDLTSAYAFGLRDLPCLACGRWHHIKLKGGISKNELALVHFRVRARRDVAWGPLPCRVDGDVVYGVGFEGHAWWPEIEAAMRRFPGFVEVIDWWVYKTPCRHRPFAFLDKVYRRRKKLEKVGSLGPADLLKQAMVASYGKLISKIESPFQSFVWAGVATSIVRAKVLEVIARHRVISVATDAVVMRGRMPEGKGLGAWTLKGTMKNGAFFSGDEVFSLDGLEPEEKKIVAAWRAHKKLRLRERHFFSGRESVVAMVRCRRCGRSQNLAEGIVCTVCGIVAGVPRASYLKTAPYGTWGWKVRVVDFDPMPAREEMVGRLFVRDLEGIVSEAFSR